MSLSKRYGQTNEHNDRANRAAVAAEPANKGLENTFRILRWFNREQHNAARNCPGRDDEFLDLLSVHSN